jgi:hypothetical protein
MRTTSTEFYGCEDPLNTLTYMYLRRGRVREVQSGTRTFTVRDDPRETWENMQSFLGAVNSRNARGSTEGNRAAQFPCVRFDEGRRVVVDAVRTYGAERLVCVRWFFDRGGVYVGDCRWLPEEIVVKPIQAAEWRRL